MTSVLVMFGITVLQNASFTLVSRARNSGSVSYHAAAAVASNGVWLLVIRQVVTHLDSLALMLAYMGNWTLDIAPRGQDVSVRLTTAPIELKPFATIQGLPIPGALVSEFAFELGLSPDVRVLSRAEVVVFLRERLFELGLDAYRPLGDPTRFLGALATLFARCRDEDVSQERYLAHAARLATSADRSRPKRG